MSWLKIVIVVLLALSAFLAGIAVARSQSQTHKVMIFRVEPTFRGAQELRDPYSKGNILGFSCSTGANYSTDCYVLMDATEEAPTLQLPH